MPGEIALTMPVEAAIVATDVLLLVQVPEATEFDNVDDAPTHNSIEPVAAGGFVQG